MKVLMIAPDNFIVDRRIIQEAKTLTRAGHEVHLISGFECPTPGMFVLDGVNVQRYQYSWIDVRKEELLKKYRLIGPFFPFMWLMYRLVNRLIGGADKFEAYVRQIILRHDFDVLHIHDFPLLKIGVRAAKQVGAKVFYDAHELYPALGELGQKKQLHMAKVEKRYVRQCSAVSTINPYIAQMMADNYDIPLPLVILNAAEPADVPPRDLRKEFNIPEETLLILYQGWLAENRQLDIMVRALPFIRSNFRLIVVGYGGYLEKLKAIAEETGMLEKIIFLGRVESSDLPAITLSCDVGLIPYAGIDLLHTYCSPNKLFEFIMAGLPIITNPLPFLKDVIDQYGCGMYADITTPEGMSKAINTLLENKDLLNKFNYNSLIARKELNWEAEGKKLIEAYNVM